MSSNTNAKPTLTMEDLRAATSVLKESTPCVISYDKGQCNERLAQAVWARVIAKQRLVREVGSEEQEEGQLAASTRHEAAAGAAAPWRKQQQPNYVSCARRTTKAIETAFVSIV